MPIELPSENILDEYRLKFEAEIVKEFKSNGFHKLPKDHVLLFGFREGFEKAKKLFFQLVTIK